MLPFALSKSLKAIVACFQPHNKCINDGVPYPDIDYEEDVHDINVMADLPPNPAGLQIRQRLVQRFKKNESITSKCTLVLLIKFKLNLREPVPHCSPVYVNMSYHNFQNKAALNT